MKIISFFNHKGGVSKTTTAFNLGWALAARGNSVLLVDADPQCNLTGMALSLSGTEDFENFYRNHPTANLYNAVRPAFGGAPEKLIPAAPVATRNRNLLLLAGHIDLSDYEPELAMAHKLAEAMPVLRNLPGALGHLIRITAESVKAKFVIVDMSPSVGALNQNLLFQSDAFVVPTSPDFFCLMAIDSLARILPNWNAAAVNLRRIQETFAYKIPTKSPRFIGMLSQRYRPREGHPTEVYQRWIDRIVERVNTNLVPQLARIEMSVTREAFEGVAGAGTRFELAQIADFNSLIGLSQSNALPIFALEREHMRRQGVVLEQMLEKRDEFRAIFDRLAASVEGLSQLL